MQEREDENQNMEEVSVELAEDSDSEIFELTPEDTVVRTLAEEKKRSAELFEKLQRLKADFENYKKRMETRFTEVAKYASEGILLKMLDVYDNILRSLEVDFSKDSVSAKEGIIAIEKQMSKIFDQEGVRSIKSLGEQFDPYYQHAIGTENDPEKPDGEIVKEFQKGFMIREKVLRPALVCVNRHEDVSKIDDDVENTEENTSKESE
jgi:molecular chaperone GrpE